MKMLKMAVLLMALLVVSGLRAKNMPGAQAEDGLSRFRIGSETIWELSCLEVVDGVDADEIIVKRQPDSDVPECRTVQAMNVPVSDFRADEMQFTFHEDSLCMYSYSISKALTDERYEYLISALNSLYGETTKQDFSAYALSNCSDIEPIEDSWANIRDMKDGKNGLGQRVMLPLIVKVAPKEMYQWTIGDHTCVTMFYCESTSIFGDDALVINYSNMQPHGRVQEAECTEYNVDGL